MPPTVWHMIWQNLATWQTEVLHAHICTLASVAQMHVRLLFPSDPHKDLFLPSLIFCSRSAWVSSCDIYVALLLQIYCKDVVLDEHDGAKAIIKSSRRRRPQAC